MRVWLQKGSCNLILGFAEMSSSDWRMIFVSKHAKGSPIEWSSLISSIRLRMCLHKQKGILINIAFKNRALFKISLLLRTVGQRLCWTIFASRRSRGEKTSILMGACARSSPSGWAWKKSLNCSKVGGSKTSLKGFAYMGSTGTPIILLITCGSTWKTCPWIVDWRIMPLSSSYTTSRFP
jgi:hypothetical protein